MAKLTVTDSISNVDPGSYKVSVSLKDSAGVVICTSADTDVVVPVPADVPDCGVPAVVVE
jgi:hypothetical protein